MLSGEKTSGTFILSLSIVGLVIVAISMGSLVNKRIGSSSLKKQAEGDIGENTELIKDLQEQLKRVESNGKRATYTASRVQELERSVQALLQENKQRKSQAEEKLPALRDAMQRMQSDYSEYRKKVRYSTWAAAIGETHPAIHTIDGKNYHDVTIRSVTEKGISISHKQGLSLIPAASLGADWQSRFQWSNKP